MGRVSLRAPVRSENLSARTMGSAPACSVNRSLPEWGSAGTGTPTVWATGWQQPVMGKVVTVSGGRAGAPAEVHSPGPSIHGHELPHPPQNTLFIRIREPDIAGHKAIGNYCVERQIEESKLRQRGT